MPGGNSPSVGGIPAWSPEIRAREAAQHLLLLSALPGLGAAQEKLEKNGQGGLPLFISCSFPGCSLSWGTVPRPFSQLRAGGAQQEAHGQ